MILSCSGCGATWRPTIEETENLQSALATPSHRLVMAQPLREPFTVSRPWESRGAYFERGTVAHLPTYFEDPFEDKGSKNGVFETTWEDWLAVPYGHGRWMVNYTFVIWSLLAEPAWSIKYSDGRVGEDRWREHDASADPAPNADSARVEWDSLYENRPDAVGETH